MSNPDTGPSELLEIRRRAAQVGSFQGYRPASVAVSGAVGLGAGVLQATVQPDPFGFVVLWSTAALLGFGYNLFCIARNYGASPRRWERSLAFAALTDLSPAVLAGLILTLVLPVRGHVELLPGLWMILFGTGILSSRRHLPQLGTLMGGVYLLAGMATLTLFEGETALRAEVMASVFGFGQLVLAFALNRSQP